MPSLAHLKSCIELAIKIGKGRCALVQKGNSDIWFSTTRIDPATERHIQNLNLLSFHGIQQKGDVPTAKDMEKSMTG